MTESRRACGALRSSALRTECLQHGARNETTLAVIGPLCENSADKEHRFRSEREQRLRRSIFTFRSRSAGFHPEGSNIFRTINIAATTGILVLDIVSVTLYRRHAHLAILAIALSLLVHT